MLTRRVTTHPCASPTCWRQTARRYCDDCELQLMAAINLQCWLGLPWAVIRAMWA